MTMHNNRYDVIVIGAGSMGMATGYYLAKQGVQVLLIDAFDPPHDQGSHFGETRIIRHAYGEGREYVPLALRSQQLWDALEKKSHLKIFSQVGAIGFGAKDSSPFIDEAIESGKAHQLDVNYFTGPELESQFPGLQVPEHYHGFYEPHSGLLYSDNCIQAYRELAIEFGAHVSFNNRVIGLKADDESVEVTTEKGIFTANKLIISAGAWTNELTSKLDLELPLVPSRQPVAWFKADETLFNMNRFPVFMAELPSSEEHAIYYGFPSVDQSALKIGRHDVEDAIDPDTMNREFGFKDSDEAHLRMFLDKYMPNASGPLEQGVICMYTRTPDGHFIIDNHPTYDNVLIAAGFSGHGFKFASVVGEILSQLVICGETEHDISLFKLDRASLQNYAT